VAVQNPVLLTAFCRAKVVDNGGEGIGKERWCGAPLMCFPIGGLRQDFYRIDEGTIKGQILV